MIRYKDEEFEDYNIDPVTAIITDKNGVVQKIYRHQGRSTFKRMPVHCIMVHTHLGYKPGMDIHHLDENKLNNALSNLVYLTRSEHIRLHFKGKQLSTEICAKISASHKGKPLSEEQKVKISASMKGKKASEEARAKMSKYSWFTNDKINIRAIECPEGFRKGRCPWRKIKCVLD